MSNLLKNKAFRWLVSFLVFLFLTIAIPQYRYLFLAFLLLHIPVLIWGIIDIRNSFFCPAFCHKKGEKTAIALTFDDGPDPQITPQILELLGRFGYTATFFVIARKAERHPEIIHRIIDEGHTIACHDLDHRYTSNFRLTAAMVREIGEAREILRRITGKTVRLYRPPVGLTNPHLKAALEKLDMECIGWSGSVRDGGNRFRKTFRLIPELARPGSVVLLHDTIPDPEIRDEFLVQLEKLFLSIREKSLIPSPVYSIFGLKPYS